MELKKEKILISRGGLDTLPLLYCAVIHLGEARYGDYYYKCIEFGCHFKNCPPPDYH